MKFRYLSPSQRTSIRKDFAQRLDAVNYFTDMVRSAFVRELYIAFDVFDVGISEVYGALISAFDYGL